MNGQNMFYDKKTTRMYVALRGKTQETRRTGTDSIPRISVFPPPLDTMLTIQSYIFPEPHREISAPVDATTNYLFLLHWLYLM